MEGIKVNKSPLTQGTETRDKTKRVRWTRKGIYVQTSLERVSIADVDKLIDAHNHELCNLQQIVDLLQLQLKRRK